MRSVSGAFSSALSGKEIRFTYLAEFVLDGGTLRLALGNTVQWNGTWNGAGSLGRIEQTTESAAGDVPGLKLELTGVPSSYVSMVMQTHVQGRQVNLYLALFDADGQLIDAPTLEWSGLLNTMQIADNGETAAIAVTAESRLIDFGRARIKRFNAADHKRDNPGDEFFSHVEAMVDATIVWPSKEWWKR